MKENNYKCFEQIFQLVLQYEELKYVELKKMLYLGNKLSEYTKTSSYKLHYELNIIDLLSISEQQISELLKRIFEYNINGEYIIVKSFFNKFIRQMGKLDTSYIHTPIITAEKDRIDVLICEEGKYVIIVENKLKGANYQPNQIARYINKVRTKGYNDSNIFIVLLPCYHDKEYIERMDETIWKIPSEIDSLGEDLSFFKKQTIVIDSELPDWLENECIEQIPHNEVILKSAIIQLADFLKGIFNNRINQQLFMEIEKFLREHLLNDNASTLEQWEIINEKLSEISHLQTGLSKLKESLSRQLIEDWRKNLLPIWGELIKHEEGKSFGININGVWCGCWCGHDNGWKPYWGFYAEEPTAEQRKMVEEILEESGIGSFNKTTYFIAWQTTRKGDERCEVFFKAAQKLNYIPNK